MTGILELFALVEVGSGIGFLANWRNRTLSAKVNYFHRPHDKKSPLDEYVRRKAGRPFTRQDHLHVQFADGLVSLVRTIVQYGAFRQCIRGLVLAHSPMRRALRMKGGKAR
jgi:hypothetical protein